MFCEELNALFFWIGLPPTCGNEPNPPVGCCHGNCLSGCYGPARNECLTCRAVHHVGACMDMCPKFTYKVSESDKQLMRWLPLKIAFVL